jgi:hypothetical protein
MTMLCSIFVKFSQLACFMGVPPLDKRPRRGYSWSPKAHADQERFMMPTTRIAIVIVAGTLFGCATTAENANTKPAVSAAAKDPACLTDTGSRVAATSKCRGFGRAYSSEDIDRTGKTSAADALALLDPSITVRR